jgi:glutamate-ammonia-ligase adenylyltransferase
MPAKLEPVRFRDPGTAESRWARLKQSLAPALMGPLDALLHQSPDPDSVLNLLERYVEAAPASVLAELGRHPRALTYLTAAFGQGNLLADAFLAEPNLALQFARDRHFTPLRSQEDLMEDYARFSTTESTLDFSEKLARFKGRNYARIALKDVLGMSTLAETTLELSALADVIVAQALLDAERELSNRYGQPQYRDARGRIARSGFSIVSLGKLGGNELNYSSDIDLLFLYARDGETSGAGAPESAITNREYFTRLAQAVATRLTRATAAGQVFRVDLRLRPEGDQGDLTLPLASALDYYARRARDWELQMLIKARHSAGDARLTRAFLQGVDARIYSSPGNRETIRSILYSRERMSQRLRESRREAFDVKRHPGGIRDIELLTQCLQRLYGAREPWVRSGGTLHALRKLNDKGLLSDGDYASLTSAYEFLRRLEHRIQLDRGQQSHRLPAEREAIDRLARRAGVESEGEESPGRVLLARLRDLLQNVSDTYQRLLDSRRGDRAPGAFELRALGSDAAASRHSYHAALRRLEAQASELASLARESQLPPRARPRAARFLTALVASSEALAFAREQPAAMERAFEVLRVSDYLSDLLVRHPRDLIVLASGGSPSASSAQLKMDLPPVGSEPVLPKLGGTGAHQAHRPWDSFRLPTPLPWVSEKTLSGRDKMALLRQACRAHTLELGARDCTEAVAIYDSLRNWTSLAATAVATAFVYASQEAPSHESSASSNRHSGVPPVAVLSLGRLGLSEFDLGSDADLIFLMGSDVTSQQMLSAVRVAEKTIEALSSYTRDGAVVAVDTRLRPRGSEGEMVITEDALLEYAAAAAQPWEAVTYLKACPVAGDPELARRVTARLAERIFDRFGSDTDLAPALRGMRHRLEKEPRPRPSLTKTAAGGYYDVDFAVSYLRIRHHLAVPPGSNMAEQIKALREGGILSDSESQVLIAAAGFLRALDHAGRLVRGRPARGIPEHPGEAEEVEHLLRLWGFLPSEGAPNSLPERLNQVRNQTRAFYSKALS